MDTQDQSPREKFNTLLKPNHHALFDIWNQNFKPQEMSGLAVLFELFTKRSSPKNIRISQVSPKNGFPVSIETGRLKSPTHTELKKKRTCASPKARRSLSLGHRITVSNPRCKGTDLGGLLSFRKLETLEYATVLNQDSLQAIQAGLDEGDMHANQRESILSFLRSIFCLDQLKNTSTFQKILSTVEEIHKQPLGSARPNSKGSHRQNSLPSNSDVLKNPRIFDLSKNGVSPVSPSVGSPMSKRFRSFALPSESDLSPAIQIKSISPMADLSFGNFCPLSVVNKVSPERRVGARQWRRHESISGSESFNLKLTSPSNRLRLGVRHVKVVPNPYLPLNSSAVEGILKLDQTVGDFSTGHRTASISPKKRKYSHGAEKKLKSILKSHKKHLSFSEMTKKDIKRKTITIAPGSSSNGSKTDDVMILPGIAVSVKCNGEEVLYTE